MLAIAREVSNVIDTVVHVVVCWVVGNCDRMLHCRRNNMDSETIRVKKTKSDTILKGRERRGKVNFPY